METAAARRSAPATGTEPPPAADQLGLGRHVVRADRFDSLIEGYDSLAMSLLIEFRERYDGAIGFQSQEEFDWLASNGYPLPEEILDAAAMSLQELQARAATGDEKAELLYFDRLNQEVSKARRRHLSSGLDEASLTANNEFLRIFVEADKYRSRVADNASPFAGYVLARFYETALANPYAAAGALYLAGTRGDYVAMLAAKRVIREHGIGPEARDALAACTLVARERDPTYYQPASRPGP